MSKYENGSLEEALENMVEAMTIFQEATLGEASDGLKETKNLCRRALADFSKAIIDEMVKEVIKQTDGKMLVTRQ